LLKASFISGSGKSAKLEPHHAEMTSLRKDMNKIQLGNEKKIPKKKTPVH
jgi:hypothetical protein